MYFYLWICLLDKWTQVNLKSTRLAPSFKAGVIYKTNFAFRLQVLWDPGGVFGYQWLNLLPTSICFQVKDQFEDLNQHLSTCRGCNLWWIWTSCFLAGNRWQREPITLGLFEQSYILKACICLILSVYPQYVLSSTFAQLEVSCITISSWVQEIIHSLTVTIRIRQVER